MWYRCTSCSDIDICYECFTKDIHKHHKAHLKRVTAPPDWKVPYCHACVMSFQDTNGALFTCTACEDYCLCHGCKRRLQHINHSKHLKEVSVEKYNKDIG